MLDIEADKTKVFCELSLETRLDLQ